MYDELTRLVEWVGLISPILFGILSLVSVVGPLYVYRANQRALETVRQKLRHLEQRPLRVAPNGEIEEWDVDTLSWHPISTGGVRRSPSTLAHIVENITNSMDARIREGGRH
jgi:hypothetical protein